MGFNEEGFRRFFRQEEVQDAMSNNDINLVYDLFGKDSDGMTSILTSYLREKGIEPIDFVDDMLWRDIYEFSYIREITIPGRIKIIGESAFRDCEVLEKVFIEDGVQEIREYAFTNCYELKEVHIPKSVTKIDDYAFMYTSGSLIIYCDENSIAHQFCMEYDIKYLLNDKKLTESLKDNETLIEDVQDNANEEKRIIDDIRKLLTEQGFEEEEKLNGIAFTQELNKPTQLMAQFYVDTTDLSHSSYIKSDEKDFTNNYSTKGDKDSLQKSAALFLNEFIQITTADII